MKKHKKCSKCNIKKKRRPVKRRTIKKRTYKPKERKLSHDLIMKASAQKKQKMPWVDQFLYKVYQVGKDVKMQDVEEEL